MENNKDNKSNFDIQFYRRIGMLISAVSAVLVIVIVFFLYLAFSSQVRMSKKISHAQEIVVEEDDFDKVENGIHVATGLAFDDNFQVVRSSCTSCHSAQLIIQNRSTREGWEEIIRWMQATQGLTDLGDREPMILDYLAKHYAPKETGRRPNIDIASIEWYNLNLD